MRKSKVILKRTNQRSGIAMFVTLFHHAALLSSHLRSGVGCSLLTINSASHCPATITVQALLHLCLQGKPVGPPRCKVIKLLSLENAFIATHVSYYISYFFCIHVYIRRASRRGYSASKTFFILFPRVIMATRITRWSRSRGVNKIHLGHLSEGDKVASQVFVA